MKLDFFDESGFNELVFYSRRPHQTGPSGFHTTTRELQTCTLQGPYTPNTMHEKTPRERRKSEISDRSRKKKEQFGPPTLRGSTVRAPPSAPCGPEGVCSSMFFFSSCCSVFFAKKARRLKHQFWTTLDWPKVGINHPCVDQCQKNNFCYYLTLKKAVCLLHTQQIEAPILK